MNDLLNKMNDKLDETDAKIKDEVDIKYQGGLSVQPIRMSDLLSFLFRIKTVVHQCVTMNIGLGTPIFTV